MADVDPLKSLAYPALLCQLADACSTAQGKNQPPSQPAATRTPTCCSTCATGVYGDINCCCCGCGGGGTCAFHCCPCCCCSCCRCCCRRCRCCAEGAAGGGGSGSWCFPRCRSSCCCCLARWPPLLSCTHQQWGDQGQVLIPLSCAHQRQPWRTTGRCRGHCLCLGPWVCLRQASQRAASEWHPPHPTHQHTRLWLLRWRRRLHLPLLPAPAIGANSLLNPALASTCEGQWVAGSCCTCPLGSDVCRCAADACQPTDSHACRHAPQNDTPAHPLATTPPTCCCGS